MDHRWDEDVRREHATRREHERYDVSPPSLDPDVERRDQLALDQARARGPRPQRSPWDIGAEHYDQRDLYTRNARVDDGGYGRGPDFHPEVGSYAYVRREHDAPDGDQPAIERWPSVHGRSFYAREAWPWIRYEEEAGERLTPPRREDEDHGREDERRVRWRDELRRWRTSVRALVANVWRGRPSDVERTDVVLRRDAYEALWRHRELDASDIEVFVVRGDVTLAGTVRDHPSKRLAERVVEPCRGVRKVHNRLRVRRDDPRAPFAMGLRAYD